MSDSDHERLLDLIAAARGRLGEAVLADPARLVPFIADQAPALRPLARATAAALAAIAAGRAAAEPGSQDALAREAAATGAPPGLAWDAAGLALRAVSGAPAPVPEARTEWVGASVPVAAARAAAPPLDGPVSLLRRYKWGFVAAAAAVMLYLIGTQGGTGPEQAPPPAAAGPGQPVPVLVSAPDAALPIIPLRQQGEVGALIFDVPSPTATLRGIIALPGQGWDGLQMVFARPGAEQAETMSLPGAAELRSGQSGPMRVLRPRWSKDGLAAGNICVVFMQRQGSDVQLRGSQMCLLEFAANDCRKVIGCGRVG